MNSSRPFIIAANWKMHKSPREAVDFFEEFVPLVNSENLRRNISGQHAREIIFFIPAIGLYASAPLLRGTGIGWGAQNIFYEAKGAFTGENSPEVVKEIGATHTLVGHSERRSIFHESDSDTAKKVRSLQAVGLTPILCVGESLSERESGRVSEVIVRQLRAGLSLANLKASIVIAYEPIWAIGSGQVPSLEQINEAHGLLRAALKSIGDQAFAERTAILYGGSVKPVNSVDIGSQSEVDGFLVGGASLEVAPFLSLCQSTKVKVFV